ncbi:MAG: DUF4832 domain-containing protein [Calditrichia bacterium]
MIKLTLLWLMCATVLVAGFHCSRKSSPTPPPDEFVLEEIDGPLPNPFKGFAPWVGNQNPVYDTRLQYKTYEWRELEPQQGVFNWNLFEQGWGNIAVSGRRVGFRISACTPGSGNAYDIPDWLANQGVALRPYSIDGHTGLAPDWDDPRFLQAHHELIAALGERYDQDDRVAWIDIGSYGFWGEWHVWLNDSLAATQPTKQAILQDYFDAFPTKAKVIAFDDDFATEWVTSRGGGIRNDCLGTAESNDWYLESLNQIDPGLNERVWKHALITGEFCGGDWGAIQGTTERFELNYQFIQQTHWSFIGPAGGAIEPQNEEHRRNLDKLHKKLGYRFVLKEVENGAAVNRGEKLEITIQVENKGVAPFYFPWPLVVYLLDSAGEVSLQQDSGIDIRQWLPGSHTVSGKINIPAALAPGSYEIRLAIHDPASGKPGVLFANTGKDEEGRYRVGRVHVK